MKKVLVTGCLGQIGSELITRLRQELGSENVIATDIRMPEVIEKNDIFEILDVMDYEKMRSIAEQYQVDTLIRLAALLSAVAEAKPQLRLVQILQKIVPHKILFSVLQPCMG